MTVVDIKKVKDTKKSVIKGKLKFENYKDYLEATQLENKMKHLEKKTDIESFKEDKKEFIKNNQLILKMQEIYKYLEVKSITFLLKKLIRLL